jgi:hypothetical protein
MTFWRTFIIVSSLTVLAAHVAPSVDDNNRYLKLTPLAGGARLAYTVFFGEIPGASERRLLDTNRDGRIDEAEANTFGQHLAGQVAESLQLEVAGHPQPVRWAVVDVGLGNDAVAAGSFSVDMIAYVCVPGAPHHQIRLRDQFRIPRPGETEVKVEDSPGTTVTRARIGDADDPRHDYRFAGAGGPLSDAGLEAEWTTTDQAPALPPGSCANVAAPSPARRSWLIPVIVAAVLGAGAAVLIILRRLERRSAAS